MARTCRITRSRIGRVFRKLSSAASSSAITGIIGKRVGKHSQINAWLPKSATVTGLLSFLARTSDEISARTARHSRAASRTARIATASSTSHTFDSWSPSLKNTQKESSLRCGAPRVRRIGKNPSTAAKRSGSHSGRSTEPQAVPDHDMAYVSDKHDIPGQSPGIREEFDERSGPPCVSGS